MKIYLLRHTSLKVNKDTFYGQSDVEVSNNFYNEVSVIKRKINEKNISEKNFRIFSSPLQRCKKLAGALFENFIIDDRLKELDFGDWEMKHINEIPCEHIKLWEKDIINFKIPNGESNSNFYERLKSFCDYVLSLESDIFVVAHAGSINCIISYLANIPFQKLVKENWKRIGYGSLSSLKKKKDFFEIDFLGK